MTAIVTIDSAAAGPDADIYILPPQPAHEGDEYKYSPGIFSVDHENRRVPVGYYPRRNRGELWVHYVARCERAAVEVLRSRYGALCVRSDSIDVPGLLAYREHQQRAARPSLSVLTEKASRSQDITVTYDAAADQIIARGLTEEGVTALRSMFANDDPCRFKLGDLGWLISRMKIRPLLYWLDRLEVARAPEPRVWICQGEHFAVPGAPMTVHATEAGANAEAAGLVTIMVNDTAIDEGRPATPVLPQDWPAALEWLQSVHGARDCWVEVQSHPIQQA